jgi:hypothetical protein
MCYAMAFMVVGAVITAASAIKQGEQAEATGKYVQNQAAADAQAAQGEAELQARQIRDAGKRQRAAATAASAASGLSINDGTAELINNEITQGAEQDALTTILSGRNGSRRMLAQGEAAKIQGENAKTAGYMSAIGSTMTAASGWKSSAAPTTKQSIHAGGY